MKMELLLDLNLKQKQSLSQNQIQSLKILELTSKELKEVLYEEYLENPLLDYDEQKAGNPYRGFENEDLIYTSCNISIEDSDKWRKDILEQLNHRKYTDKEWSVYVYMIEMLDEDGIFRISYKSVADALQSNEILVSSCHQTLMQLEPSGIFSTSVKDYLLKQIDILNIKDNNLQYIIENCLAEVANGHISMISRKLKISTLEVRKYIEIIKRLSPRPLTSTGNGEKQYITPDIIVQKPEQDWEIYLNDDWINNYSINDYYLKMMKETKDKEILEYFMAAKKRYEFFMNSIEKRRETLLKIAEEVLEYQEDFFLGQAEKTPISMTAIADKMGVHTSTVSRAIKGKYIQVYKQGTFIMSSLFSAPVSQSDGVCKDAAQIKRAIVKLIEGEDAARPYSDSKLVKHLEKQNITVARRTIAKYREELNIPNSVDRKII